MYAVAIECHGVIHVELESEFCLIFFCPRFESHHFLLLLNSLFLKSLYFVGYRLKNDKRSNFGTERFDEYEDGSIY